MYVYYNPNPDGKSVGDCTVRAICKALDLTWEEAYLWIVLYGLIIHDMPSGNRVWGDFLKSRGFKKYNITDTCPDCYTVKDFCFDHKAGTFVLGIGDHVVTVVDGDYFDSWDSGNEVPAYFYARN